MPELPEVHTTVTGLQKVLPGKSIRLVWTDLAKKDQKVKMFEHTLKSDVFFRYFKKIVTGQKIKSVTRRAKNILIHLEGNYTILIHMKMTGHLLYGTYKFERGKWIPKEKALLDPYNRFIHVAFELSNGKMLAFCDSRKFGTVKLLEKDGIYNHFKDHGPEPLDKKFTEADFIGRLYKKPVGKIKTVLMDSTVISGIGNIYSDEMLWLTGINPEERVKNIPKRLLPKLYTSMKKVLFQGIDFGGDSMSDYRRIDGTPGNFQHQHNAYRKTGKGCSKADCKGVILRKVIGGRSAHYCSVHQKLT